jgi:phage FluMu protein Com
MNFLLAIKRGKAIIVPNGLRCQGPRLKQPDQLCNKLLVRKNTSGQISGSFKCDRCGQLIDVELRTKE